MEHQVTRSSRAVEKERESERAVRTREKEKASERGNERKKDRANEKKREQASRAKWKRESKRASKLCGTEKEQASERIVRDRERRSERANEKQRERMSHANKRKKERASEREKETEQASERTRERERERASERTNKKERANESCEREREREEKESNRSIPPFPNQRGNLEIWRWEKISTPFIHPANFSAITSDFVLLLQFGCKLSLSLYTLPSRSFLGRMASSSYRFNRSNSTRMIYPFGFDSLCYLHSWKLGDKMFVLKFCNSKFHRLFEHIDCPYSLISLLMKNLYRYLERYSKQNNILNYLL